MSADRGLSPYDRGAVERARETLAASLAPDVAAGSRTDLMMEVGRLQATAQLLLRVVDRLAPTRSERLAAQRDQEFLNLARAARTEIHAAGDSIKRLDAFEQALTGMLHPDAGTEL